AKARCTTSDGREFKFREKVQLTKTVREFSIPKVLFRWWGPKEGKEMKPLNTVLQLNDFSEAEETKLTLEAGSLVPLDNVVLPQDSVPYTFTYAVYLTPEQAKHTEVFFGLVTNKDQDPVVLWASDEMESNEAVSTEQNEKKIESMDLESEAAQVPEDS